MVLLYLLFIFDWIRNLATIWQGNPHVIFIMIVYPKVAIQIERNIWSFFISFLEVIRIRVNFIFILKTYLIMQVLIVLNDLLPYLQETKHTRCIILPIRK